VWLSSGFAVLLWISFLMAAGVAAGAQQTAPATPQQGSMPPPQTGTSQGGAPAAKPSDVNSIDSIVKAVYAVISGPGGTRDWDRFRSLFFPGARLIPTGKGPDGSARARVATPEDYIERSGQVFAKEAFYEREKARRTEQFGNIAHVFSTYESRHSPDAAPFQRGINSIQLFNDGKRWWVLTIVWDAERPDSPIPDEYLK
jgi:hypothetical protein